MKITFTILILVTIVWGSTGIPLFPFRMDRAAFVKAPITVCTNTCHIEAMLNRNAKVLQSKAIHHFPEGNYLPGNSWSKIGCLEELIKNDCLENKKIRNSALSQTQVKRYRKEYGDELLLKDKLVTSFAKECYLQSSLEQAEEKEVQKEKEFPMTGYEKLEFHLDAMGKLPCGRFTYFRGLDLNFVNTRFSFFLQDDVMRLALTDDFKWEKGKFFVEKYIPRISTDDEYITVKYDLRTDHTIPPYFQTDDGSCEVITKVEIEGTADLIIKLFNCYWPNQAKLGAYKQGEIAHYQIMGDYVMLVEKEKYNIYKIIITKGSIEADYYKMFKIESKK